MIVSRVPQQLPIEDRLDLWTKALDSFMSEPREGERFEILPSGDLGPL